jgi:hypothetical protein
MQQNTKDWIQYASAIAMLVSAIALALWSFYKLSEVHSSVLAYVGEAIAFVAGVYGLALYAKHEIKKEFTRWEREGDTAVRSEEQKNEEGGEI